MSIQASFFRWLSRLVTTGNQQEFMLEDRRRLAKAGGWVFRPTRGTSLDHFSIGKIPAWWFTPPDARERRVVLFLHGGGWVYGWVPFYNVFSSRLAGAARARLLAIDYRISPEEPFPAALEDCLATYRYLLAEGHAPQDISLIGDSAGGNLVITTMLAAQAAGLPLPACGVCLSPASDLAQLGETYRTNARKDAVLHKVFADFARKAYLAGQNPRNPLISPVYGNLGGLPPLLIQAGEDEVLLSDARSLAAKAAQAGIDVTLHVYPEMWHVWQVYAPYLPEAQQALEEIGAFIQRHA